MQEPPDELTLADTIGVAVPSQVKELTVGVLRLGTVDRGSRCSPNCVIMGNFSALLCRRGGYR
jgi:hypothetical protein